MTFIRPKMRPNIAPMVTAPAKPATICAGLSICGGAQLGVTRTQQVAPMWIRSTNEMETWGFKHSKTSVFGGAKERLKGCTAGPNWQ